MPEDSLETETFIIVEYYKLLSWAVKYLSYNRDLSEHNGMDTVKQLRNCLIDRKLLDGYGTI